MREREEEGSAGDCRLRFSPPPPSEEEEEEEEEEEAVRFMTGSTIAACSRRAFELSLLLHFFWEKAKIRSKDIIREPGDRGKIQTRGGTPKVRTTAPYRTGREARYLSVSTE